MVFWLLAIVITGICCAALYYASSARTVNASAAGLEDAATAHYRLQLAEINADIASGRMPEAEGAAARGELAREVMRLQREAGKHLARAMGRERIVMPLSLLAIAVLAVGIYTFMGRPDLPAEPLAQRTSPQAQNIDVNAAIGKIEEQLAKTPDDLRGWTVIAPVYLQMGRYDDAVKAFRRITELSPPTPSTQTDLAEALLAQAQGKMSPEALNLLQTAAKADPNDIRSRFYLAGYATEQGDYADAVHQWNALLALGTGNEPWMDEARQGLAAAQAGLDGKAPSANAAAPTAPTAPAEPAPAEPAAPSAEVHVNPSLGQSSMITGMVEGLNKRLTTSGGSLDEWAQLVRSYLVLGNTAAAQTAYDSAKQAYPDANARSALDELATKGGLK
ncbi:MAG TPA: c-type cytochrome biogenesis protein CcmI [Devosiaceae bacterium]|jgi:cytochrome c-type biogenesis protein CcmH